MARLRDDDKLRLQALTSPLRIELIGAVKEAGACSVRELAGRMGRRPDALYHHVRLLLKAGVLAEVETRKVGRRSEAVYGLAAPRVAGRHDPDSPASRQAVVRAASAALRLAAREFEAAIESGEAACVGDVPRILAKRQTTRLDDAALAELNELLTRLEELLSGAARAPRGRPYSLTTVLIPLTRRTPRDVDDT